MEKHEESLSKALSNMRIADHMLYVTYPIIKDKRLLLKTLEQVYDSVICTINSILYYDYLYKRVQLYPDPRANFDTFINKCSKRYNITDDDILAIKELISLAEMHKKSSAEFTRREKIVIMAESLKTSIIDTEKLKKYLNLSKKLVEKAKFGMNMQE